MSRERKHGSTAQHCIVLNHGALKVQRHYHAMTLVPGALPSSFSLLLSPRSKLLLALSIIALIMSNIVVWLNGLVTVIKPHAQFKQHKFLHFYHLLQVMFGVIMVVEVYTIRSCLRI